MAVKWYRRFRSTIVRDRFKSSAVGICRALGVRFILEIVVLCVTVQIGIIVFTSNLTTMSGSGGRQLRPQPQPEVSNDCDALNVIDPTQRGRYDSRRRYVIQDSVFVGVDWPPKTGVVGRAGSGHDPDVCLATQTSIDKLDHLSEVASHWQGFISLAIFTPGVDRTKAIAYLERLCARDSRLMRNVSVHFVFPAECNPAHRPASAMLPEEVALNAVESRRCQLPMLLYPQNLMRNVARKNCAADYVLLTDIDMVPVMSLAPKLSKFLGMSMDSEKNMDDDVNVDVSRTNSSRNYTFGETRRRELRAYVLPTYEIKSFDKATNLSSTMPANKSELLQLVGTKKARAYRSKAFRPNQGATNSKKWESLPTSNKPNSSSDDANNDVTIAYQVPEFRFYYEPFYLAEDTVPPHDERFVGYGFTRNTQVYEMLMAGYKFYVLDNAFLVHRGMNNMPFTSGSTKHRQKQVHNGWMKFMRFMDEIKVRYRPYRYKVWPDYLNTHRRVD